MNGYRVPTHAGIGERWTVAVLSMAALAGEGGRWWVVVLMSWRSSAEWVVPDRRRVGAGRGVMV
jgi:hypothetical protein